MLIAFAPAHSPVSHKARAPWEVECDRAQRAQERRLPPSYFERFSMPSHSPAAAPSSASMQGRFERTVSPTALVAASRVKGATRRIAPSYERLTFDKEVATCPRRGDEEAALPQPEPCGPGHPPFDALIAFVISHTRTMGASRHKATGPGHPCAADGRAFHQRLSVSFALRTCLDAPLPRTLLAQTCTFLFLANSARPAALSLTSTVLVFSAAIVNLAVP